MQNSEFGHKDLPTLCDSRPAGAPALQWNSAFCSAGALAGVKTTGHDLPRIGFSKGLNWKAPDICPGLDCA